MSNDKISFGGGSGGEYQPQPSQNPPDESQDALNVSEDTEHQNDADTHLKPADEHEQALMDGHIRTTRMIAKAIKDEWPVSDSARKTMSAALGQVGARYLREQKKLESGERLNQRPVSVANLCRAVNSMDKMISTNVRARQVQLQATRSLGGGGQTTNPDVPAESSVEAEETIVKRVVTVRMSAGRLSEHMNGSHQ